MKPKKPESKKRQYDRGYSAGRRNIPFSFLMSLTPEMARGWGAGQEWLRKQWNNEP